MLQKIVRIFGGNPNKRQIDKYTETVNNINSLEGQFETYSDDALRAKTSEFRQRLAEQTRGLANSDEWQQAIKTALEEILPEAFATVREASKRTLGQRHYDVQLVGGIALHQGKIAEMRTGEGKTLVATLPLYLNALTLNQSWLEHAKQLWGDDPNTWKFEPLNDIPVGRGVHLVTVNDYLARRDARWMSVIFTALGLNIGVLQMASRTEEGRKAFLVDLERTSPHEDQNQLQIVPRREAYAADITYGMNSEYGFDYLRDNMSPRIEDRVQRGHYFAIVDEVDNILIDEARTPLIISGPAQDDTEWYVRMAQVVRGLNPEDYEISERDHTVTLTEIGETHVEELVGVPLSDPERPEDVTPEQARMAGYLEQALRAQFLFRKNKEYLVQAGKVLIVDEFTGRLMPGRRWSDGLHQAVEAKEGVRVQRENVTYATITIQNYFRMYEKLAGMSGTALTEAEEFDKIYKLGVLAIPTNLEFIASRENSDLEVEEGRDELGYKFEYYTHRDDKERKPVYFRRKDYPDVIYRTEEIKLRAIAREIMRSNALGQPVLVGTTSVELSERVSNRLRAEPLRRLAQILLLRQAWMKDNKREEDGRAIPELVFLNSNLDELAIADMRKMARELELSFNPESSENLEVLSNLLGLNKSDELRLASILQAGVPHQVLNARKHSEESQIIANAGAFGAVTIATNMAGRGVDIKLGGELPEDILSTVNRVLNRAGHQDPYDLSMEDRHEALLALDSSQYGIYEDHVHLFLKYMGDMQRVKELGGLHVIGSERHEARRIDNQLRGRAARQGDPGSSRFYLSMEDELMRLFGGQQADALMQRLKIDDFLPLEVGMVGRIVEQAQTRVEGQNFDIRKHLLEYDDVLNTQRARVYSQRDRIFTKDDLSEDVTEMLQTEVLQRIPKALENEEGPWTLLAWLEQIQPSFQVDSSIFPSYQLRLLKEQVLGSKDGNSVIRNKELGTGRKSSVPKNQSLVTNPQSPISPFLEIAQQSLIAEEEHIVHSVANLLEVIRERLQNQLTERLESIDTFFEGLREEADQAEKRSPRQLVDELSALVHLPIKLSPDEQRTLRTDPKQVEKVIRNQVESSLLDQAVTRSLGAVERRLEEDLDMNRAQLDANDWDSLTEAVILAIRTGFERRRDRLIGGNADGTIVKDLNTMLEKVDQPLTERQALAVLVNIPQGARAVFDRRTHKRVWNRTNRLSYFYYSARFLENRDPAEIASDVLNHLQQAQAAIRQAWGNQEWGRLAPARPVELDETTSSGLYRLLGESRFSEIKSQPLQLLPADERGMVIDEFGRQALTGIYRQLILGVISELWVEYLTNMEALRVSIGLEAYAQRDPLIQYKNRAFEMFQELLSNMRLGVITRMFTYRPRDLSRVQSNVSSSHQESRVDSAEPQAITEKGEQESVEQASKDVDNSKAKHRRRRH